MTERSEPSGVTEVASDDLLSSIMRVVRETPKIEKSEMCHGEPHWWSVTDYKTIEDEIGKLLNGKANRLD